MDAESRYAFYCIHKFHWAPSKFDKLPLREKAFVMASIDTRIEDEREQDKRVREVANGRTVTDSHN